MVVRWFVFFEVEQAKAANTTNGGIIFQDGDSETMGYLYWDGSSTANFGFLDATGSWAVKCRENEYVQLLYLHQQQF